MLRKTTVCALLLCLLSLGLAGFAQRRTTSLTNRDVVNMLRIGLPEGAIIAAIEGSPSRFDTSGAALNRVKRSGASQRVLDAMKRAGSPAPTAEARMSTVTTLRESSAMVAEVPNAIPETTEANLVSNTELFGLLLDTAAAISPATCVESKADTMAECHKNYVAGCSYSQHPRFDPYLNYIKNLLRNPNTSPDQSALTRSDFINLEHSTDSLGLTQNNHDDHRQELIDLGEGRIRKLMGVLYYAFPSDEGNGESCNCYLTDSDAVDFHIGIGFAQFLLSQQVMNQFRNGADVRSHAYDNVRPRLEQPSVVVEMTPHYRAKVMPGWTIEKVHHAIGRQVLVVGQLMVDNAHLNKKDNCSFPGHDAQGCWRLSAWELHPVTKFYVCTAASPCSPNSPSGWTRLEDTQ